MKKILFENGTTIDGASTFNQMQNNVEEVFNGQEPMGSIVVDDIECKNVFNIENPIIQNNAKASVNGDTLTISETSTGGWVSYKVNVEPNTIYTLSGITDSVKIDIDDEDIINNLYVTSQLPFSFNTGNNSILSILLYVGTYTKLQLEKGDKSTPHTLHKEFGYITGKTNGIEWIKYDNGRCELSGRINIQPGAEGIVIFPFELINNEYSITLSYFFQNYHMLYLTYYDIRKELFKFNAFQANGASIEYNQDVSFHVIGRWKDNATSSVSTMSLEE